MTQGRERKSASAPRDAEGLISFVPRLAVELGAEPGNRFVQIAGSMLSADISGFTALSERLAGKGKAGAEEITELINTCFAGLIGEAYARDGEVIKFGGDAILVLFRGDAHQARAAAAGLAMQRTLHASGTAKRANLTMTVGAHTGVFDAFLVGTTHRELLVTGATATTVIELEGNAEKGDTLVSPELLAAVPELESAGVYGGGHRVEGLLEGVDVGPAPRTDLHVAEADLAAFLPIAVTSQLDGVLHLGGEHRQLGICFLMVGGVTSFIDAEGGERTAEELGRLVDHVIDASEAYDAAFLHTDIAPHGAKFVITAGAPTSSGNNADAVLHTALRVAGAETPFDLRLGVQVGRGFAGFLGATSRRAYTVMGDPVNTAARMLGKAGNRDVIAMNDVMTRTDTIFVAEELEPFRVKGKSAPVVAHRVIGASDETRRGRRDVELIGRDAEVAVLEEALRSGGRVVELVGPAGSGKTRIVETATDHHPAPRFPTSCTRYGAASPYAALRPLLRAGLGIDLDADPRTTGEILTREVRAACDHLRPMVPLIAVPLGAEVPSTTEVDAIDPEFRRQAIERTVADLLEAVLPDRSTLIVEDVQWIDEASADMLAHLAARVHEQTWVLIVTRRDVRGRASIAADGLERLDVAPMADEQIRRLVIEASIRPLNDTEVTTIAQRSAGNPLFAIELTRALSDDAEAPIPDSVERLLATRIDQLDPASRLFVRMASVLGPEARIDEVRAVVEAEAPGLAPDYSSLGHILERRGKDRIAFTNALYRDAAYEGLPYARRRRLHRVVAEHLELSFDGDTAATASASLLALHYSEAAVHDKAWTFGVLAGDLARAQSANNEAAAAYRRALRAASRARQVERDVIVRVAETLGDCLLAVGDFDGARAALDRARRANDDLATEIALMRRIGVVAERQGRVTQAVRWFNRARRLLPDEIDDPELLRQASFLSLAHAGVRHRRGDNEGCLAAGRHALGAAIEARDARAEAKALQRMHLALTYLRRPDEEGYGLRSLELFRELEEHDETAMVLNNLGIAAYFDDNWPEAIEYYAESASERAKAGNTADLVLATMNTGELLSDQGHWDRAAELLADTMRNCEANGYVTGLAATQLFAGVNERRREHWREAEQLLEAAHRTFVRLGIAELADEARSRLVELATFRGDDTTDAIRSLIDEFGPDHPLRSRLRWMLALTLAVRDEDAAAAEILEAEITLSSGVSRARTIETLLALQPDRPDAAELRQEVDSIFRSAGVVAMARLPFVAR